MGRTTGAAAGGGVDVQYVSGLLAPSQATFEKNNWNLGWSG